EARTGGVHRAAAHQDAAMNDGCLSRAASWCAAATKNNDPGDACAGKFGRGGTPQQDSLGSSPVLARHGIPRVPDGKGFVAQRPAGKASLPAGTYWPRETVPRRVEKLIFAPSGRGRPATTMPRSYR